MRKRAYRAVAIKNVNVAELLPRLAAGRVQVGVDIAKNELLVTVQDASGAFQRPWKVKQPSEIRELVSCLLLLSKERLVVVAMESTGTYGDCLRQALTDAGLIPHRVSSKAVKDHAEVFDGVPSNHDGKDAAIIAELTSFGKARPWPSAMPSQWEAKVERQIHWLDTQQDIRQLWLGRIEALVARHWPELLGLLKLNSPTLLRLINRYGSPGSVAKCGEAEQWLRKWGRAGLTDAKIKAIVESARSTVGVRMADEIILQLREYAGEALKARQQVQRAKKALKALGSESEKIVAMAEVVGPVTACVLWATVGDPENFHCGEAYRKAMGLNLKERSSGKHQGKLKITKRGPSMARRWLYFRALRVVQQSPVKKWYQKKKDKDQGYGSKGLVAVMRKLALAVYAVTVGKQPFQLERLLPGKPLPSVRNKRLSPGACPQTPRIYCMLPKRRGWGGREIFPNAPLLRLWPLGRRSGRFPPLPYPPPRSNNK
jgi:transposase